MLTGGRQEKRTKTPDRSGVPSSWAVRPEVVVLEDGATGAQRRDLGPEVRDGEGRNGVLRGAGARRLEDRYDPLAAVGSETRLGDARIELLRATVVGDRLEAEVRYGVDDLVWRQAFRARLLGEAGLREVLADGGLAFDRWLARPGWFVATAAPHSKSTPSSC